MSSESLEYTCGLCGMVLPENAILQHLNAWHNVYPERAELITYRPDRNVRGEVRAVITGGRIASTDPEASRGGY